MPEPNGRDIFNEPSEVKSIRFNGFHDSRYLSITLRDLKNFGTKPLDFGTKCPASITEALTPPEVSILCYSPHSTYVRPEAARLSYMAASPGLEEAPKMGDESA